MKTNTKIILSFIGGAAIGGLISFALLKEKFEEEMSDIEKNYEELDEMREKEIQDLVTIYDRKEEENKTYIDYVKKYNPGEMVKDMDIDRPYPIEEDYSEDIIENNIKNVDPFVISRVAYDDSYPHFDKITLTYYSGDGVLVDEQDELLDDVESVVGTDWEGRFGDISEDEHIVHVRNGRLGADYEIIFTEESFSETVLGLSSGEWANDTFS